MKPIDDRVMVKIITETITKGGIHLPDNAEQQHTGQALVIMAGPGKLLGNGDRMPMQVKEGDTVQLWTQVGYEISVGDETYRMVRESDIFLVEN